MSYKTNNNKMVKYVDLVRAIMKEIEDDKKKCLTNNDTPTNIADSIHALDRVKDTLSDAVNTITEIGVER